VPGEAQMVQGRNFRGADAYLPPTSLHTPIYLQYTVNLWYRYTYKLTDYKAGVLLRYYCIEKQMLVLPLSPFGKWSGSSCLVVPAPLVVFEKIYTIITGMVS